MHITFDFHVRGDLLEDDTANAASFRVPRDVVAAFIHPWHNEVPFEKMLQRGTDTHIVSITAKFLRSKVVLVHSGLHQHFSHGCYHRRGSCDVIDWAIKTREMLC